MGVKRMASLGGGSDWGRLQGHGRRGVTGDDDREGTNQEVLGGGADRVKGGRTEKGPGRGTWVRKQGGNWLDMENEVHGAIGRHRKSAGVGQGVVTGHS